MESKLLCSLRELAGKNLVKFPVRNSELNLVDILTEFRARRVQEKHEFGVDLFSMRIVDAYEAKTIGPLIVNEQALKTVLRSLQASLG